MDNTVSILIPSRFDNRYILELCIRSIRKYTDHPYKIIIGDAGLDEEAKKFLETQDDLTVIKCPDPLRPKDFLAGHVKTPYFMFLHDDVQILKKGWLRKRVEIMSGNPHVGILGIMVPNFSRGWARCLSFSPLNKRFFPLALLVRNEMQEELNLFWGLIKGFDPGAIAYLQFLKINKKKKWKFIKYGFSQDIKHWSEMTWVLRKKHKMHPQLNKWEEQRRKKDRND